MTLKSPYRQSHLAPRCRLFTSWSWRRFQGFSCSLIKVERELGLERCKTVWSLSAFVVWKLKRFAFSTRGPKWNNLLFVSCFPIASWFVTLFLYNYWKHQCRKTTFKRVFKNKYQTSTYFRRLVDIGNNIAKTY